MKTPPVNQRTKTHDKPSAELIKWPIIKVLAVSERPGFPNPTVRASEVNQWLRVVLGQGIRSVINLLSEDEMSVYYRHLERPLMEYYKAAGLDAREVSDEDMGIPVKTGVFLERVLTAFKVLPKPVLIHCNAGAERSGLAVETISREWESLAQARVGQSRKKSPDKAGLPGNTVFKSEPDVSPAPATPEVAMSLQTRLPSAYRELEEAGKLAEKHLRNAADLEFTIQNGQIFVLSVRTVKVNPAAKIKIAFQLLAEGIVTPEEILERIQPSDVTATLRPEITDRDQLKLLGKGMPAVGGVAAGRIALNTEGIERLASKGHRVILVVPAFHHKQNSKLQSGQVVGVLTFSGGVSSHAVLACRMRQTPCVIGFNAGLLSSSGQTFGEGDLLTIDGATGEVFAGKAQIESKPRSFQQEMALLESLIKGAAATAQIPPKVAGNVWRIWDFQRHGRPLTELNYDKKAAPEKRRSQSAASRQKADAARKTLHPLSQADQANVSEILLGLVETLDRLFRPATKCWQPFSRALWWPEQQYRPAEASQLVGFEYFGMNPHIPHLSELASLRIHLECKPQSPSETWIIKSSPGPCYRLVPRCRTISACQIWVNEAELMPEDLPQFYTWLRRREYFEPGLEKT